MRVTLHPESINSLQTMLFVNSLLIVIATWWIGTGVVLYIQQRVHTAGRHLVINLLAVAAMSLMVLKLAAGDTGNSHSYAGFIAAVSLWGCLELSYFTGLLGGIHSNPCPPQCRGFRRFGMALGASIWHEITVLAVSLCVVALCWQEVNHAGLSTFLVLCLMRWSAKLNLFFGVPNFNADWFPDHLAYARSYMKRASVSLFFPLSVLAATITSISLMIDTLAQPASQALMYALPCVLLMLAILEHLFMVLPIADSALWNRVFAVDGESSARSSDTAVRPNVCQKKSADAPRSCSADDSVAISVAGVEPPTPESLVH
ncbi:MAG: DUF3623 domain-containing protein [Granulosicoccus sp.]|nr:DUF3623 domain-containing protein [Granulosicoccus sp.]